MRARLCTSAVISDSFHWVYGSEDFFLEITVFKAVNLPNKPKLFNDSFFFRRLILPQNFVASVSPKILKPFQGPSRASKMSHRGT